MKLGLDAYAQLASPIHRWETRTKLVALVVLIFAFASVQSLALVLPMVGVTAVLFALSNLPLPFLLKRLVIPGYFLGALIISFPFLVKGTPLVTLGPVTIWQEGVETAVLVSARFLSILTVSLILFGTAPFLTTIKAMRALGLPLVLTDMILLTYRYLFEMSAMFDQTKTAVRLRGFQNSTFSLSGLSVMASLIGHLLVRSYDQADRVYHAMILRGYGSGAVQSDVFVTTRRDWLYLTAVLLTSLLFIVAQIYLTL